MFLNKLLFAKNSKTEQTQSRVKNVILDFIHKKYLAATKLDVIIFGASGRVGRHVVKEAVELLRDYTWGVAGRDSNKLVVTLREIGRKKRTNLATIPIFLAKVEDQDSLLEMVIRCSVLVNCCGPYEWLGEPVVQACLKSGTHYVDLCMGSHFSELMELKYHDEAMDKNIYVISACGWQSMPIELGINYLQERFNGTINSIESHVKYWSADNRTVMPFGGWGSWASIVMNSANTENVGAIRDQTRTDDIPELKPASAHTDLLHESDLESGVSVPFPVIDQQVVERSQYYFYEHDRQRPVQFSNYITLPNWIIAAIFLVWLFIISVLAQFALTRSIMLKFPAIFSVGLFTENGPNDKNLDKMFFRITLRAVGWSRKGKKPTYVFAEEPDKTMTIAITGRNPMYGVGSVCLLASAMTIINEASNMPEVGGVYSPGAAFAKTNIISLLEQYEHGFTIEVLE